MLSSAQARVQKRAQKVSSSIFAHDSKQTAQFRARVLHADTYETVDILQISFFKVFSSIDIKTSQGFHATCFWVIFLRRIRWKPYLIVSRALERRSDQAIGA